MSLCSLVSLCAGRVFVGATQLQITPPWTDSSIKASHRLLSVLPRRHSCRMLPFVSVVSAASVCCSCVPRLPRQTCRSQRPFHCSTLPRSVALPSLDQSSAFPSIAPCSCTFRQSQVKLPNFGAAYGRNFTLRVVAANGNSSSLLNSRAAVNFFGIVLRRDVAPVFLFLALIPRVLRTASVARLGVLGVPPVLVMPCLVGPRSVRLSLARHVCGCLPISGESPFDPPLCVSAVS